MKELTEAEVMAVSGAGIASDAGKILVRVLAPSWMPAPVFSYPCGCVKRRRKTR